MEHEYMIKFTTGTGLRQKSRKLPKKTVKNHVKLAKNSVKTRYFALHQWVPIKNMTMRTAAVQPRILS